MPPFPNVSQASSSPLWLKHIDRWSELLIGLSFLIAAILLCTLDLGGVPLRDWDEGIVAQVAKEIATSPMQENTWLHPTLHGAPYFNKPPFVHWWVAIAYLLGGVNEWTARLPGALSTAISVLFLYRLGRELFPQRLIAVFSTGCYLTLLPVIRHGRLAMLDGVILCAFLGLLICLLRSRYSPHYSFGMGLGLSVLMLTKGIIVLPLLAIALLFVGWDSPRLLRSPYWWFGVGLGCIPGLSWYLAQGLHYGTEFWEAHLFKQSLDRVSQVVEQHSGPPWYYLLELLKYSWPWMLFLPMGLKTVWQNRSLSWAKLILLWGGCYFCLISVMGTKLPWYIMPIYPVLALTIGIELNRFWVALEENSPTLTPSVMYRRVLLCFIVLLAILGWGGLAYLSWETSTTSSADVDSRLLLALGALGLTMTVAAVLLSRRDRQCISILVWGFYCCLLLFVMSPSWNWELGEDYPVKPVAAMIQQSMASPVASQGAEHSSCTNDVDARLSQVIITSHPVKRPSLDFYSGYNVKPMGRKRIEKQWNKDPCIVLLLSNEAREQLKLEQGEVLGQEQSWTLVRRKES